MGDIGRVDADGFVELVGRASGELGSIFSGVDRISDRIREVVHGLNEQTMTLGEINTAISQLDTVTQQNAAMVNQTASAIRSLTQNSRTLSDGVRVFRIDGLGAEPALQHDPEPRVANAGW